MIWQFQKEVPVVVVDGEQFPQVESSAEHGIEMDVGTSEDFNVNSVRSVNCVYLVIWSIQANRARKNSIHFGHFE